MIKRVKRSSAGRISETLSGAESSAGNSVKASRSAARHVLSRAARMARRMAKGGESAEGTPLDPGELLFLGCR
jgi:hypothetical protein